MDIWLFNSDVSPCLLVLWNSTKLTIASRNLQKHVNSFNMMVSKTRVRFPHAPLFDSWKDNSFQVNYITSSIVIKLWLLTVY